MHETTIVARDDLCIRCGEIAYTLNFDEALKSILDAVEGCLDIDAASIYLLDPAREKLEVAAFRNLPEGFANQEPPVVSQNPVAREVLECKLAVFPDAHEDPDFQQWAGTPGIQSALGAPLKAQDRTIGILWIYTFKHRDFSQMEKNTLTTLASQGGVTLWNSKLHQNLHRIAEVGKAVTARLDLSDIFQKVMGSAIEIFGGQAASVYLVNMEKNILELSGHYGLDSSFFAYQTLDINDAVNDCLQRTVVMTDASGVKDRTFPEQLEQLGFRSLLCAPLRVRDKAVGIVRVYLHHMTAFSDNDRLLLSILADFSGIAIENARLYNHIKRDYEDLTRDVWHWYDWGKKSPKI